MVHDVKKIAENPVKSKVFDPFKYGYITEIQSQNSMLFDKVLDYAIFKAIQSKSGWSAEFTLNELTSYPGVSYSSYNKTLRTQPKQRFYQIYNETIELFASYNYHAGSVSIVFSDNIEPYMEDLKEFISYDIDYMFLFKHKSTQLLYKLLYAVGNKRPVKFSLNELRDYLFPYNKDIYPKWAEFNRNVLNVAKKDLESLAAFDLMTFDYNPILSGKGGKVEFVDFFVYYTKEDVVSSESVVENSFTIKDLQDKLGPEVKISKDAIKKVLPVVSSLDVVESAKKLFLTTEYIRDKGLWIYYCIQDQWWDKFITVINSKEVIGDGIIISTETIYSIYQKCIIAAKNDQWDVFLSVINTSHIFLKLSNQAHCFLIKEIIDVMILKYLGYNVKPHVTQVFVDSMGYDIYQMIDKLKILKLCNKDYSKQYFKTFEKLSSV